eukprot:7961349-Heterocapsa_arctica.AAC.1
MLLAVALVIELRLAVDHVQLPSASCTMFTSTRGTREAPVLAAPRHVAVPAPDAQAAVVASSTWQ